MAIKNAKVAKHHATHKQLQTWWTPEEYEALTARVTASGLTKSEYVRCASLGVEIRSRGEERLTAALAKLGGLLLKLNADMRDAIGEHRDTAALVAEHNKIYKDIRAAILAAKGER